VVEVRKQEMSFTLRFQRIHGNLQVCNADMMECHWGMLHQKCQI